MDELLEFAKNLDYDKYMDDIEVQAMMEQVRTRILNLEQGVAREQRDIQALLSGTREEGQNVVARMAPGEGKYNGEDSQLEDDNDDARSVAKVQ